MNASTEIKTVPLHKLHLSPLNARKVKPKGSMTIDELGANIKAVGLIQNLVVVSEDKEDGKRGLGVVAGGRRLTAMTKLLKNKEIPRDFPVPVKQVSKDEAANISLSENVHREAMHPADEFEAWAALVDAGKSAEDIAAAHGVTPATVERRLRLARVSPKVMASYRSEKINLDQVMAFTLTTDHKRQEALLRKDGQAPHAWQIKEHLTEKTVRSNDCRALLIGREAYEAAGGVCREDMFSDRGTFYYEDPALLDRMVADVLEAEAAKLRKKYPWVEVVHGEIGYTERSAYGTVPVILGEPTPKAKRKLDPLRERLAALQKEQEAFENDYDDSTPEAAEASEAKWQAFGTEERQLEKQIDAIEATLRVPDPDAQAIAGAVIGITSAGKIDRLHNRIRPQDKARVQRAATAKTTGNGHPGEEAETQDVGDPQGVRTDLTTFATAVAQEALADNVGVALRVLALQLMDRWNGPCFRSEDFGVKVSGEDHANLPVSETLDGSGVEIRRRERQAAWEARFAEDQGTRWQWLLKADDATVLQLLAYCTARTLACTQFQHMRGDSPALPLLQVLGVDLRAHWAPNAGYFRRIKKATTLQVLAAHGHTDPALAKAKRDPLAEQAEALLAASGWLAPSLTLTNKP